MASMIPPTNKLISGKIKETAWPLQSENQLQKKIVSPAAIPKLWCINTR